VAVAHELGEHAAALPKEVVQDRLSLLLGEGASRDPRADTDTDMDRMDGIGLTKDTENKKGKCVERQQHENGDSKLLEGSATAGLRYGEWIPKPGSTAPTLDLSFGVDGGGGGVSPPPSNPNQILSHEALGTCGP